MSVSLCLPGKGTSLGSMSKASRKVAEGLRKYALGFPEAWEDYPWGERVAKVGKKVFVFFGRDESGGVGFSVKLPVSGPDALALPFATPTGYGLGKAGWVSFDFPAKTKLPVDAFHAWIEESYRAVAPKKLVASLEKRPKVSR
jgi:predicted DNA-binding protein (MmcQ/YjbR family)